RGRPLGGRRPPKPPAPAGDGRATIREPVVRRRQPRPHPLCPAELGGRGGLPDAEAAYVGVAPDLPVGEYTLTVGDVPVDGFWSISVYNADGFFEPDASGAYSVNSITAARNDD